MRPFEDWLPTAKTIAIAGICKNAGKTTLLNSLLAAYPEFNWGILSTGIDGEETDTVFKHPKPRVHIPRSSLFICDTKTLNDHQSDVTILSKLAHPSRPLWYAKAMTDLNTEITGPATVNAQDEAIRHLFSLGAQKVLVDGSLDRKSITHSQIVDDMILAVGASFGTLDEILDELERIRLLTRIPEFDEPSAYSETVMIKTDNEWIDTGLTTVIGHEASIKKLLDAKAVQMMIPGALTSKSFQILKSRLAGLPLGIVVQHPDHLKLELSELQSLLRICPLKARLVFCIKGLALNSWAAGAKPQDASFYRSKIQSSFPDWDIFLRQMQW